MKIFIMNRTGIFQKATQRARILLADNINRAEAAVVSTTTSLGIEFSTAVARWLKPNLSTGAVKSNLVRFFEFRTAVTRRLKWAIYTSTFVRLVLIKVLFSTHFHQILHSNGVHFRAVKLFQNMLHRLQLGPRSTPGGLQTRVEFPLHDDSVWEMGRHSTKWTRFL